MSMKTITTIPPVQNDKAPLRVAIYCRVSTPLEIQQLSLDTQAEHYQEMISRHMDWLYTGTYTDVASGTNKKRPQFNAMMEACKRREIDLILTKSVSRFARNTVDALEVLNTLKLLGVNVYFEVENLWLQQQTSMFSLSLFAAVAQEESVIRSENIKWGIHAGFRLGTSKLAGRICYGYQKNEHGGLCIHPEQATVVRRIFRLYLDGYSLSGICKELSVCGISSPTGKEKWTPKAIEKLLSNEKYTGNVLLQKTYITDYWNHRQGENTGEFPQFFYENNHPAIIDPSVFEAVQREKECRGNTTQNDQGKTVRKNSRLSSGNTLSGKIVCGTCGRNYRRITTHGGDVVWRCAGRVEKVKHKCTARTLAQKTIIEELTRQCNMVDLHLDFLPQAVEQIVVENEQLHVTLREINAEKRSELLHLQDHWLCQHYMKGDQRAGEMLYVQHSPLLKRRLYFLQRASSLTKEDMEDLEQTVWFRTFQKMKSYDSRYRFWTWMKQIIRSEFSHIIKQKKRRLREEVLADMSFQSNALSRNIDGWISDEYVSFLLTDLTDREYKIVTRHLFAGDTQRSLTKEMGLSKSRVSQIYLEALEKMRKKIDVK